MSVRFTVTMLLRDIEAPDATVAIPYIQANRTHHRWSLLGRPNMSTLDAGTKMLAKPFTVEVLAAKIHEMLQALTG